MNTGLDALKNIELSKAILAFPFLFLNSRPVITDIQVTSKHYTRDKWPQLLHPRDKLSQSLNPRDKWPQLLNQTPTPTNPNEPQPQKQKTKQIKTKQNKSKQNKTKQNKTKQNKNETKQNKTKQKQFKPTCSWNIMNIFLYSIRVISRPKSPKE